MSASYQVLTKSYLAIKRAPALPVSFGRCRCRRRIFFGNDRAVQIFAHKISEFRLFISARSTAKIVLGVIAIPAVSISSTLQSAALFLSENISLIVACFLVAAVDIFLVAAAVKPVDFITVRHASRVLLLRAYCAKSRMRTKQILMESYIGIDFRCILFYFEFFYCAISSLHKSTSAIRLYACPFLT